MAATSTSPRTCAWPASPADTDVMFDAGTKLCGVADPSFDAHYDATADPVPVCDKHKPAAEAEHFDVTDAGEFPASYAEGLDGLTVTPLKPDLGSPEMRRLLAQGNAPDVELVVLHAVADAMALLPDDDTRRRVATWVADRYGVPL